jgi:manganese efflux pump family protein
MDVFAVSISAGFTLRKVAFRHALILAFTFGIFQAVMPLIGWIGGLSIREYIEPVDHWIAFILLGCIGANMIREALMKKKKSETTSPGSLSLLSELLRVSMLSRSAYPLQFFLSIFFKQC